MNANMDDIDTWEYNNAALGLSKFTRTDARYVGIAYDSPEWAGFNFNVLYSPRDNVNGADRQAEYKSHLGTGEKYSVGLNYKNSGWFAKYGFDYLKNSGFKVHHVENGAYVGENKDGQVHRLEGGYDANNWFVGAGYQYTKNTSSYFRALNDTQFGDVNDHDMGVDNQGQEAALTVGYHFGNIFPKISYAHGWDAKINGTKERNTKYDQIVIGADYAFSKRTTANVQAGWLREGNGYTGTLADPAHNDVAQKSNGKTKTTAIGVGLKHVF